MPRRFAPQTLNSTEAPEFPAFGFDDDYTSPYPCMVCKVEFRSRHELATHPHPKREV